MCGRNFDQAHIINGVNVSNREEMFSNQYTFTGADPRSRVAPPDRSKSRKGREGFSYFCLGSP